MKFLGFTSDDSECVMETCAVILTKLFSCKVRKILLQSPDRVHLLVQRVLVCHWWKSFIALFKDAVKRTKLRTKSRGPYSPQSPLLSLLKRYIIYSKWAGEKRGSVRREDLNRFSITYLKASRESEHRPECLVNFSYDINQWFSQDSIFASTEQRQFKYSPQTVFCRSTISVFLIQSRGWPNQRSVDLHGYVITKYNNSICILFMLDWQSNFQLTFASNPESYWFLRMRPPQLISGINRSNRTHAFSRT